ncbi:MAG TPA: caspase family protein [Pyrinomonadaceae bacterium]|nr:caspase family protein [Pyrinomonadaceae bacterium]
MKPSLHLLSYVCLNLAMGAIVWAQQKPELVVQTGHSDIVDSLAFSADGQTLATGSRDQTIKLWAVASGHELRTLRGHSNWVASVALSADGKTLASGSYDKTIKLWDVATGRELHTLTGHSNFVVSVAFSPDGKTLASGSYDKTIKLWEVATGRELRTLTGHPRAVSSVAFTSDGKTLASGSFDKTIKLWEVDTGLEVRTFRGHSESVTTVSFSADGKMLASGSEDNTIKLWEVATGRELRTLTGHSGYVHSVAFSADGKMLASSSEDKSIKLWIVATGQELRTLTGHSGQVYPIAFNADRKTLASAGLDKTIKLWDVATGRELRTLVGHTSDVYFVTLSATGMLLATGNNDGTVKLWEVATGRGLRTLASRNGWINTPAAFSPDEKMLASVADGNAIKLWDTATGRELRMLAGHAKAVTSVAFSGDGKILASGSEDNTIKLWEVATGNELRTLKGHSEAVSSVAFSADGLTLASGSFDNTIKLWEVATGSEFRTLTGHTDAIYSVAFSGDGKMFASGSWDKTIKLWDVLTGRELRTLRGHSGAVTPVAFSADGKMLASGSHDKTIKLWEVATGRELRTLTGHSAWVDSVAFSTDGRFLLSGGWDTDLKLWRVDDGEQLASLIALDEKDWAVVTPEGLFDGSPNAWKKLIWRLDNNTFKFAPVEAFFQEFYRPGLLQEIMSGKRPKPPTKNLSEVDIRQPSVTITRVNEQPVLEQGLGQAFALANSVITRGVEVEIQVTDNTSDPSRSSQAATSGAQDLRLFRNGSLVKLWKGNLFDGQNGCEPTTTRSNEPRRAVCKAKVPLVGGDNNFTSYAFNQENVKSNDSEALVKGADGLNRTGVLHVFAVGVNDYENKAFNLSYAVPDAEDFGAELKKQQEKLKNYERTEIIPLYNEQATKEKILGVLKDLAARVQPEDSVVVYFAGHGTVGSCLSATTQQVNAKDRFYLVPHDLGYHGAIPDRCEQKLLDEVAHHSISDEELTRAFEGIDAGQLLLVIDACNSGQALESEETRRGPMNSRGLAQLAYEKGMYILTAAQSLQEAKADKKIAKGHGYLTYALVEEGLKTKAAADRDGNVLLREWVDYAVQRVPRMQQAEAAERRRLVKKQVSKTAKEEEDVQTPRVFYRREPDLKPLIVARP